MKIRLIITLSILGLSNLLAAQRYIARDGYVHFFSEAPLENIEAVNKKGMSILDLETGEVAFTIPVKAFEFDKALMQQHFNENYLESDRFPEAVFKGVITGLKDSPDEQILVAKGLMTIHGVSNQITVDGNGRKSGNSIFLRAVFPVKLKDYTIKIPKVVLYNIAEIVDVTIEFEYKPHEK